MLEEKIRNYRNFFTTLEEKRKRWQTETKPQLIASLEGVAQLYGKELYVELNDCIQNHETISLAFRGMPSGLCFKKDDALNEEMGRAGKVVLHPGFLSFSFAYNGKVIVSMAFPHLENVTPEGPQADLGMLEVEEIDQEKTEEAVAAFFDNLISWWTNEKSKTETRRPIGYFLEEEE
jgi:hypothetical protein